MKKNLTEENLLDAQQVAQALGVSKRTILLWHQNGIIPSLIYVNRTIRFSLPDVLEHLQMQSVKMIKR